MTRVLVTGAAGLLGCHLRRELRGRYDIVATDHRRPDDLRDDEEFRPADLRDLDRMVEVTRGADAVVHLGGIPGEDEWEALLSTNIGGTHHVFEAARRAGARRVVFASSNHVTGFHPVTRRLDGSARPRPDSRYGVTKAAGEAIGSLYADKYGLRVLSIRIGHVLDRPSTPRQMAVWLSPRDLAQLVTIGIEHPELRHEIVYGVSDTTSGWWDIDGARRLGYRPLDRADDHRTAASTAGGADPVPGPADDDERQGGSYVSSEGGGHIHHPTDPVRRHRRFRRR